MPGPTYATPSELWALALPPDSLFEDHGTECGAVGAVTFAGSGLGAFAVSPQSNPRDTWTIVVKCVRGGELNSNYVNPGPVPQFVVSYNGGTDFWWQILEATQTTETLDTGTAVLKVVKGGFSILMANGTAGAPVTIGSGNASLICTPVRAGASVRIVVGSELTHTFFDGALLLTVTNATTANQVAAYLATKSAVYSYFTTAAGGTGAGVVQAAALTALPFQSFTANDTWTFNTAPSPDVLIAQQSAFDFMNSRLRSSFNLPLLEWDTGIKTCECIYARWILIRRRGLDREQDFKIYNPSLFEDGQVYLNGIANGQIRPGVVQSPPGATLFPDLVVQVDPLSMCPAGSLPI